VVVRPIQVYVNRVRLRRNQQNLLRWVQFEEQRLAGKWLLESVEDLYDVFVVLVILDRIFVSPRRVQFEIVADDPVLHREDQAVCLFGLSVVLEVELHAHSFEFFAFCNPVLSGEDELVWSALPIRPFLDESLEQEDLVGLLLVLYQILTRDDSQVPFIGTNGHCNNLVSLSGFAREQFHIQNVMRFLLEVVSPEHVDLVDV